LGKVISLFLETIVLPGCFLLAKREKFDYKIAISPFWTVQNRIGIVIGWQVGPTPVFFSS
jgi:hypothetical protein